MLPVVYHVIMVPMRCKELCLREFQFGFYNKMVQTFTPEKICGCIGLFAKEKSNFQRPIILCKPVITEIAMHTKLQLCGGVCQERKVSGSFTTHLAS